MKGWQREFDDPIPLPDGRQLITLQDAGTYIIKLQRQNTKRRNGRPQWKP
jgi:hypothetical protein